MINSKLQALLNSVPEDITTEELAERLSSKFNTTDINDGLESLLRGELELHESSESNAKKQRDTKSELKSARAQERRRKRNQRRIQQRINASKPRHQRVYTNPKPKQQKRVQSRVKILNSCGIVPTQATKQRVEKTTESFIKFAKRISTPDLAIMQSRTERPTLFQWHGDKTTEERDKNIFRVMGYNPTGITGQQPHFRKVQKIAKFMKNYKVNMACISESHVNTFSPRVQEIVSTYRITHTDGLVHHNNTQTNNPMPTLSQPGGVSTFIDNEYTKKFNGIDYDPLGRWIATKILTTTGTFKVYTVYKVNPRPYNITNSAWHHQEVHLNKRKKAKKPEEQVTIDLEEKILKDLEANTRILVMADANERVTDAKPYLHNMLTKLGFINVLQSRLSTVLPPTNSTSLEAIDHAWSTPSLHSHIVKAGIAPKGLILQSDTEEHRALILDIDMTSMTQDKQTIMQPYDRRRLKSTNIKRTDQFNEFVDKGYDEQMVDFHISTAEAFAEDSTLRKHAIEKLEFCDRQLYEISMAGEKNLPASHETPWSPRFQEAMDLVHDAQNIVQYFKSRQTQYTESTLKAELLEAYTNLNIAKEALKLTKEKAQDYRQQYLNDLANALHTAGKFKTLESAIKTIKHIEQQRADAKRIRGTTKRMITSSLNHILIPGISEYPPELQAFYKDPLVIWKRIDMKGGKDIKDWITISDRDEMDRLMLEWQCVHFTQSHDTPLANETWEHALETSENIEDILQNHGDEFNKLSTIT